MVCVWWGEGLVYDNNIDRARLLLVLAARANTAHCLRRLRGRLVGREVGDLGYLGNNMYYAPME